MVNSAYIKIYNLQGGDSSPLIQTFSQFLSSQHLPKESLRTSGQVWASRHGFQIFFGIRYSLFDTCPPTCPLKRSASGSTESIRE
ncbi:MAG: hypothetical protein Q8K98_06450 [Bacteroidota bacterium]|nr:hypothetical protein [Bacteroidota bacterium]